MLSRGATELTNLSLLKLDEQGRVKCGHEVEKEDQGEDFQNQLCRARKSFLYLSLVMMALIAAVWSVDVSLAIPILKIICF